MTMVDLFNKFNNMNTQEINNKLKLRTDGLYVQFGYRPWNNQFNKTSDCWYNIIKVIDDNHYILLGHFNFPPFFEISKENHKPIESLFALNGSFHSQYYDQNINSNEIFNNYDGKNKLSAKEKYLNCPQKMNLKEYYEIYHGRKCDGCKCDGCKCDGCKCDGCKCDGRKCNECKCDGCKCDGCKCDGCKCDGCKCDGQYNNLPLQNSYYLHRENTDIDYNNCDNFEVIKNYYDYLNLDLKKDNFDVLNMVKKLKKFNWSDLNDKIQIKGIDIVKTYYYDNATDDSKLVESVDEIENETNIELENICNCMPFCNDPFSLVTYSNDTNSFYIKWSHCWVLY